MNKLAIIGLLLLLRHSALAQDMEYSAYLTASMQKWERAVAERRATFERTQDVTAKFELAQSIFGLLNATMKDGDLDLFDKYVGEGERHLQELIYQKQYTAESKALLSGILGLKIGHRSWKGMFLGSKAANLASDALDENPNSPIVQKLYGNNRYFTPDMWGGDKGEAIEAYKKALTLFEERESDSWMYVDTFAWLGQAYLSRGNDEAARETYEKALEVETNFSWIKNGLLPELARNE